MKTFYVISRDLRFPGDDGLYAEKLRAKNHDEAWEMIDESIATSMSNEWVLSRREVQKLKKLCEALLGEAEK
jgi:hypothetical protein